MRFMMYWSAHDAEDDDELICFRDLFRTIMNVCPCQCDKVVEPPPGRTTAISRAQKIQIYYEKCSGSEDSPVAQGWVVEHLIQRGHLNLIPNAFDQLVMNVITHTMKTTEFSPHRDNLFPNSEGKQKSLHLKTIWRELVLIYRFQRICSSAKIFQIN